MTNNQAIIAWPGRPFKKQFKKINHETRPELFFFFFKNSTIIIWKGLIEFCTFSGTKLQISLPRFYLRNKATHYIFLFLLLDILLCFFSAGGTFDAFNVTQQINLIFSFFFFLSHQSLIPANSEKYYSRSDD